MNLGGVTNSVIVSDGDVVIDSKFIITKSLIIARGSVQANVSQVSVMAGGDYRNHGNRPIADAPNQFLLGGKFIPELVKPGANQYLKIEQKVKEPFGVFRFFETRELGVQTRLTESKTVEVHGVDPKRHFGKAGFQNGDLIEAINGRPVESPETFRQMVRRAIVDTQAEFAIKRRGERIKLQIKFPTDCLGSETR
jgi:membrane-associated protease RseP (regulator of RpoE activity)